MRDELNRTLASLHEVTENKNASDADRKSATSIHDSLMGTVQCALWWVRILSALCLGVGTLVGYRLIIATLGKAKLVPAQGLRPNWPPPV